MGLVAPRHVGSSQTRARTRVPCFGKQILNHCATREALNFSLFVCFFFLTLLFKDGCLEGKSVMQSKEVITIKVTIAVTCMGRKKL